MGAGGPAGPGPNPTEQSLYSHLYGKEMGLMRKLTTSIDDYPTNHAAVARNYQQLLQQQQQQQQQHPDPSTAHQQQMQQNFAAGHPHAAAAAKFNQFNYPNPGGLLKPCYDYQSSQQQQHQQHPMQGPGSAATGGAPNQQMKKEIFNLSGTNGVDLYSPPASATASSVSSAAATAPSSNGSSFMNLHQPSAAAAAAAAAAMYANHHFNNGVGPNGAKLDANGGVDAGGLVDFNAMRNNATAANANNKVGNNLIKSAESVLMARSSIMNNLNNNLNKIEPNTDTTTLNDSNNNTHNHHHHHQQQQQGHSLGHGGGGVGFNGGGNEDEIDKLSSPMTGTSTLTNTDLNDPSEQGDDADDGYTVL